MKEAESYKEVTPAAMGIGLSQSADDERPNRSTQSSGNIESGLCHYASLRSVFLASNARIPLWVDLLGLHFLGNISLGTQYANGVVANPKPIKICATISR